VRALNAYIRSLYPALPRSVQTLQAGALVNAFGNGLAIPFLFIYLHNVRGFGLGVTGLIVGTNATVGLIAGPVSGTVIDRIGGRVTLLGSLALLAIGFGAYPFVHSVWAGFLASAIAGIGNGAFWPAQSSLIARLTTPAVRPTAFAVQRMMMNLGIGLGAVAGGFIATTTDPSSFTLLFLLDASTYVVYAVFLLFVPTPERLDTGESGDVTPSGYAHVLRHRTFMAVTTINLLLITAGISQFEVLPAYAKNHADVTETQIGWIYFANTIAIVLTQVPLARLLAGARRMVTIAALAVVWAVSWALVPAVAGAFSGAQAAILLGGVLVLFAAGECLHGVAYPALTTDLADPRLIGRYMAMSALSWTVGFAAGPAIAGFVLDVAPTALWLGAAAVLLFAAVASLALERALPAHIRRAPPAEGEPGRRRMEPDAMRLDDPLSTDAKPPAHQADASRQPPGRSRRARRAARR
jgi:MFS family permease